MYVENEQFTIIILVTDECEICMQLQSLQDDPVTETKLYIHTHMYSHIHTGNCGAPAHIPIFSTR